MTGIDPISAAGAVSDTLTPSGGTSTGGTPANVDNPGATLDRDAFLKLLVAQLKYQDPTQPADTSQILSQTAELTMVDRLNELAATFESSAATQRLSLAGTIVGKDITFVDEDGIQRSARVETAKTDIDGLTFVAGGFSVPFAAIVSVDAPGTTIGVAPQTNATVPVAPTPPITTTAAATDTDDTHAHTHTTAPSDAAATSVDPSAATSPSGSTGTDSAGTTPADTSDPTPTTSTTTSTTTTTTAPSDLTTPVATTPSATTTTSVPADATVDDQPTDATPTAVAAAA